MGNRNASALIAGCSIQANNDRWERKMEGIECELVKPEESNETINWGMQGERG